ncbi:MAG: sugar isomerase, partial [Rhodospirillales bacterium]|nr:sugar isomerase [Rhodospirillales bacterium]
CLVDLGHHLPNANIEQIVAMLIHQGRLGGFHFNDSKYGDDDLTTGSIRPYQLFLICLELVEAEREGKFAAHPPDLMIDASHNVKDPMEDVLQSTEAILIAYAQALTVSDVALAAARAENDPAQAQEALQDAFRTDVRPLVREARRRKGGALEPLAAFRAAGYRKDVAGKRGFRQATGL